LTTLFTVPSHVIVWRKHKGSVGSRPAQIAHSSNKKTPVYFGFY